MIRVGKKWDEGAVYIGRGSALGNPFKMNSEADRAKVCDAYRKWLDEQIAQHNAAVLRELNRLYFIAKKGDLTLGCFCAPRQCHGDYIKQILDQKLARVQQ